MCIIFFGQTKVIKFFYDFGQIIVCFDCFFFFKQKLTSIAFLSWLISASIFFSAWSRWRSCNSSLLVKVNLSVLNAKESDVNLFYKMNKRKILLISTETSGIDGVQIKLWIWSTRWKIKIQLRSTTKTGIRVDVNWFFSLRNEGKKNLIKITRK